MFADRGMRTRAAAKAHAATNALKVAINTQDVAAVLRVLHSNPNMDVNFETDSETPLNTACLNNTCEAIVKILLDHGAAIDGNGWHETPLTGAVCGLGTLGIIRVLLDAGADVNGGGGTPMYMAVHRQNIEVLLLLIEAGADVNRRNFDFHPYHYHRGSTALHVAAANDEWRCPKKNLLIIQLLLAAGADVTLRDEQDASPLWNAIATVRPFEIIKTLLDAGSDPCLVNHDGDERMALQALHHCLQTDDADGFFTTHYNEEWGFQVATALVAAGDRSWECVPTPCPGIEAALTRVWKAAPSEVHEIVKRMENPLQTLEELFPRMPDEMQCVVQEILRVVHHYHVPQNLKHHLLNSLFLDLSD